MFGSIFEEHISYAKALWAYNLMKDVLLQTVADIIHLIRFLTKHKPNQTIFTKNVFPIKQLFHHLVQQKQDQIQYLQQVLMWNLFHDPG